MEKRIELEKRGKEPAEVEELNLDNCRSTSIVGLTEDFTNLRVLSLINVGLTSLKGFPKLPNLQRLELSDNRISNGLNLLQSSPKLENLNLSGNRISDLETLQPLKDFKYLKNLDLFNNVATSIEGYRQKVFGLIKSLKYLDGYDQDELEAESEEDEVNGNEDDDDSNEEEGEDEDDEDVDDEELGLQAVYNQTLGDDSDEGDYEAEEEEEDDEEEDDEDEDEEEAEQESPARGKKRKHEDGEAN